jgi:hypothetical protein
LNRDFQDEARPTLISDQQVATPAQNEKGQSVGPRKRNGVLQFNDVARLDEIPRQTPDLKGGKRRERNVFEQLHESFSSYTWLESRAHRPWLDERDS